MGILSPLPMSSSVRQCVDALRPVCALVVPNLFHHLFLRAAHQAYPGATVFAPRGLERKQPTVVYKVLPDEGPLPVLGDDLEVRLIRGAPAVEEHLFFHRPSRTLILTDPLFHVRSASSWKTRAFLRLMCAYGRPAQTRLWGWFVRDRRAFGEGLREVLDWPFERVVMAHGEPIVEAPAQILRESRARFLG